MCKRNERRSAKVKLVDYFLGRKERGILYNFKTASYSLTRYNPTTVISKGTEEFSKDAYQ